MILIQQFLLIHLYTVLLDFKHFSRRMHLQYIFHNKDKEQHPFHIKSDWKPPVQPSVSLETYLEEVEVQLAEIVCGKSLSQVGMVPVFACQL